MRVDKPISPAFNKSSCFYFSGLFRGVYVIIEGTNSSKVLQDDGRGSMLKIENLHAEIGDNEILKGLDLEVGKGEIHAIMGPNGSGKSTLSNVLMGHPRYEVTVPSVTS